MRVAASDGLNSTEADFTITVLPRPQVTLIPLTDSLVEGDIENVIDITIPYLAPSGGIELSVSVAGTASFGTDYLLETDEELIVETAPVALIDAAAVASTRSPR